MILDNIVEKKRKSLMRQKEACTPDRMKQQALCHNREVIDFYKALSGGEISVIAEVKKASPSKGLIRESFDHMEIARDYLDSDVQAISILTEQSFFLGDGSFLRDIRGISDIPLLRKDFIIDEYQIYEAYILGADAILLIAAILSDDALKRYKGIAEGLGMKCLTEVHDQGELDRVLFLDFDIIGINNRNLTTFEEDIHTTASLSRFIPSGKVTVSESAIRSHEDLYYLNEIGVDAVLVGEYFMRSDNIPVAVSRLRHGRR